jgi:hypothetical protein
MKYLVVLCNSHWLVPVRAWEARVAPTKSAASWLVDRTRRRAASRLAEGCSPVLTDA